MTIRYSQRFLRQDAAARPEVRKAFDKQSRLLLENLNHPSLRAKKYDEALGLWQALRKAWLRIVPPTRGDFLRSISRTPEGRLVSRRVSKSVSSRRSRVAQVPLPGPFPAPVAERACDEQTRAGAGSGLAAFHVALR